MQCFYHLEVIVELFGVTLNKQQQKMLNESLADVIVDVFCDDFGYEIADKILKNNRKRFEAEMQRVLDEEFTDLAKKAVMKKLGL